jgi:hypothetical protein
VKPANVPVEGYYTENPLLTEYFLLVRALQGVGEDSISAVDSLPEYQRLRDVVSAPLYGRPQYAGRLLPTGRDALSQALRDSFPDWTVQRLTELACTRAQEADDFSLVGLAARVQDSVVLAASRESVILYAEIMVGAAMNPPRPSYVWQVDKELAEQAKRFIDVFNALFGEMLPQPEPANAENFWDAYSGNSILGRCARLGYDDTTTPIRHYHWGICIAGGQHVVQEFWKTEVWTTERYREMLYSGAGCPDV